LLGYAGGALEVGETPAQGAVREALEESGVICRAVSFVGIYDSRYCGATSRHQLYMLTFLCQPVSLENLGAGSHRHEVDDVRWFSQSELPAAIHPGHEVRIADAFSAWKGYFQAYFDRIENDN